MPLHRLLLPLAMIGFLVSPLHASGDIEPLWAEYAGFEGPGSGKHVVLIAGDEEYRSEEALPQLGKILARHHGFRCTVLFPVDPETGEINPDIRNNIPGLEALADADLMVIATRFRDLPDEQMRHIDAYLRAGKPVIGMRTATHAFNIPAEKKWAHYGNGYSGDQRALADGFGRLVLGEKWISHHGHHKVESTRGIVAKGASDHPILRGIQSGDIWGPTDVYGVRLPLPGDSQVLVLGQVLAGMQPDSPPVTKASDKGKGKNDPMMPIVWLKTYQLPNGKPGKALTTTMGSSTDLENEALRRLLVNACYWLLGMQQQIPKGGTRVELVGDYRPTPYGFDGFQRGVKPADHALSPE